MHKVPAFLLAALFWLAASPDASSQEPNLLYHMRMKRGHSWFEALDYPKAVLAYEEALTQATTPEAYLWIARAKYLQEGLEEEALDDIGRGIVLAPEDLEMLAQRANILDFLERHSSMATDLAAILAIAPEDLEARRRLVRYFYDVDEFDGAIRHASLGLVHADVDPHLVYLRGISYFMNADLARARTDLKRVMYDREYGLPAIKMLAGVEFDAGDPHEALRLAEQAIDADAEDGYPHYVKSLALTELGRHYEAASAASMAATLDPEYGELVQSEELDLEDIVMVYTVVFVFFVGWCVMMCVIGLVFASGASSALQSKKRRGIQPIYDGGWKELFKIYLQNVVFTLVTLGVYRFWAKVRNRRFHYQHTQFAGGRFDYLATGKEKFIGFLKGLAILLPALIGMWFSEDWVTEMVGAEYASMVIGIAFGAFLYMLKPLILVGSQRFNLARTTWNNLRFHFSGRVSTAYGIYLRDFFLMVITFGIYYSWHEVRVRKYRMSHTCLGDSNFSFHGSGGELFGINILGYFLSYVTLGVYAPWYIANRLRFFVGKTGFRNRRLVSRITGRQILAVGGPAMLLTIFTLGLALPWAIVRWRTLLAHTTYYAGELDTAELESFASSASSTLEGVGEAGDALGELGDMFGF